jgi:hypothetical protein
MDLSKVVVVGCDLGDLETEAEKLAIIPRRLLLYPVLEWIARYLPGPFPQSLVERLE